MISISKLLCDAAAPGDALRYGPETATPKPIVVWNLTRKCNLRCIHCYAAASKRNLQEMSTEEGKKLIHDLSDFGVPVLLFSGGEPLLREDIFELASFAKEKGIRPVLSTNGTLIDKELSEEIHKIGFGEVGISLDGTGKTNDLFRGKEGAYKEALEGIRNCVSLGIRVSLRFTITAFNFREIPAIFDLIEQEDVARLCFYHLVYVGGGSKIQKNDLTHSETRASVDLIGERTVDLHQRGKTKEVLTVANHADGIYLYLKLKRKDPERAFRVFSLLKRNGGNSAGIKIAAVDNLGNVHPDQFWWHHFLGNVRERKFGDIWTDYSNPFLWGLRNRKGLLRGRCARCRWLDLCNGNLRARAEAVFGDVWAEDPACYLTDEEI